MKTAVVIGAAVSGVALAMLSLFPDIPAWSAAIAIALSGALGFGACLAAERMTGQKSDGKTAVIVGAALSGLSLIGGVITFYFTLAYLRQPLPALLQVASAIALTGLGFGVGAMLTGGHSASFGGILIVGTVANLALFSAVVLAILKAWRRIARTTRRAGAPES